jgi:hypothetical protein
MDVTTNPYNPGPGLVPPELAGRAGLLDAFAGIVGRQAKGFASNPLMLTGLRGVGKTALLRAFRQLADEAGWLSMWIEGDASDHGPERAVASLSSELTLVSRTIRRSRGGTSRLKDALSAIESFSVNAGLTGGGVSVATRERSDSTFNLELELRDLAGSLATATGRERPGLVLLVDEMQDLDRTTASALIAVQHTASQNAWPFYVIGAGLPTLPARLAGIRSYAERYAYKSLGRLTDAEATEALVVPARRAGVEYQSAAVARLVAEAHGFPYFIQVFGYEAWLVGRECQITEADALMAIDRGYGELDGFFRARWERATKAERGLLRVIAADAPRSSRVADLAARLDKPSNAIGQARRALIDKGLIYAPERGLLALTALGMASFIARQGPEPVR